MSLTSDIKEYALYLGFSKVGVTTAEDFSEFEREFAMRGFIYQPWKKKFSTGAKPKKMFPSGKSIIALAYDYAQIDFPPELKQYIGRAYLARCYQPLPESIHGARLRLFTDFLEKNNCNYLPDMNMLPLRRVAARAGITNFGRNNFAYVDGVGSFVILYGFIVDKELEYDPPTMQNKCPKGCRKCMDACPTQAIYQPFKLNPSKCIGFNNWGRRERGDHWRDTTIPLDMRSKLGVRIHGCDRCQEACPRNQKKVNGIFPKDAFLEILKNKMNLSDMLLMTDAYYTRWIYPVMYNYIEDKRLFQRNAAVAMGNTRDDQYIPALQQALCLQDGMIRSHVAWALGRIGGKKAKDILEKRWRSEASAAVKKEISYALSRCES